MQKQLTKSCSFYTEKQRKGKKINIKKKKIYKNKINRHNNLVCFLFEIVPNATKKKKEEKKN